MSRPNGQLLAPPLSSLPLVKLVPDVFIPLPMWTHLIRICLLNNCFGGHCGRVALVGRGVAAAAASITSIRSNRRRRRLQGKGRSKIFAQRNQADAAKRLEQSRFW